MPFFVLFKSKWLANTYNQEKPNAGRSGVFFNHLIIIYRDGQHTRLRAVPACIVGANASRKTKQQPKALLNKKQKTQLQRARLLVNKERLVFLTHLDWRETLVQSLSPAAFPISRPSPHCLRGLSPRGES